MYYPYVRGRQYELLALKELLTQGVLSKNIIPIIEPVKLSPTLVKTLEEFDKSNKKICFIINPDVGLFVSDVNNIDKENYRRRFDELICKNSIQKALIVKGSVSSQIEGWIKQYKTKKLDWIIINNKRESAPLFEEIFQGDYPVLTFISDESSFRRNIRRNRGLLEDRFGRMDRNADCSVKDDEFFSDDHIYYKEDGFEAFSDYSVVGADYLESGFAPYAVAIHIVYFDDKNRLRIRHFVSDNNSDIQNPAGKFYEAVSKLVVWVENNNNITRTKGLEAFINHHGNQTYPGLGSVKKLSLMHHLELMGKYLDRED